MSRRAIGYGRCTCRDARGPGGPCPSCAASIEEEEGVREHPDADPEFEVRTEAAERFYEKALDAQW